MTTTTQTATEILITLATSEMTQEEIDFAVERYSDDFVDELESALGSIDLEAYSWVGAKRVRTAILGPIG